MNVLKDNKENQNKNSDPRRNKKFYIALTLCIAAVSAAGWSTYESVKSFLNPIGVNSKGEYSEASKVQKSEQFSKGKILEKDTGSQSRSKRKLRTSEKNDSDDTKAVSAEPVKSLIVYPSSKNILKEFSGENPVYSKTFSDWRIHQGTDFKAEEGSTVKSIADGKIKDITNDSAYGTTIVIEHSPGFTAYYSGLGETTLVSKGQEIKSGDDIGSIKNVPGEILDEPHLHLMIYQDEKFIDPMLILEKASK